MSNLTSFLRLGGISLVHCNRNGNQNEPIELKVQINKNVTKTPPSGNFVEYGDTWVGTFPAETLSRKVVKDYLIMSQTVQLSDDEITDGGVTLNDGHSITFSCSYSLAPHSVSQYSSVHGHDSSAARNKTSVGGLGYRLVVDDGFIGNRVNFSVIPVNPGLVHSRIKNCIVSSQNNQFSYVIFGKNDQYCMDNITNFEIINDYESMGIQKFSYTG